MTSAWAAALLSAYLVGSFPTAYVLVKWLKRVDVRTVGSGNVGATNVARAAGFKAGLVVFILDALKGVVAVKVIAALGFPGERIGALLCGVAAVIGHIAPLWLRFRGGKGVATTMGVLISAMPGVSLICLLVWLAVFLFSRIVSIASILSLATMPIVQWGRHSQPREVALGALLALIVIAKHHANMARLLHGTEHQWKSKK